MSSRPASSRAASITLPDVNGKPRAWSQAVVRTSDFMTPFSSTISRCVARTAASPTAPSDVSLAVTVNGTERGT